MSTRRLAPLQELCSFWRRMLQGIHPPL